MNHHELEQKETVERYVRHRLAAEERRAFQEHYFACDQCFEQVQTAARFIAGVRAAARSGVLAGEQIQAQHSGASWHGLSWLKTAFALSVATTVLLAVGLVWSRLNQIP